MISLTDSLRDWNNSARPLKSLTKEQLYKYPLADPSPDAEWAFSKELIGRRMVYHAHEAKAAAADHDASRAEVVLGNARLALVRAQDKKAEDELHGQAAEHADLVAKLERTIINAEAGVARTKARAAQIRADLANDSKRDDMVSQAEIDAYYAHRYANAWNTIMKDWAEGTLMKAQFYGWSSFLTARGSAVGEDVRAFKRAEGFATLVNQQHGPTFTAIRTLYQIRVMPTITERREFLADNEADGQIAVANLKPEQKRRYWTWWRSYNNATLRQEWRDDSGVAYDDRLFNPNKYQPEERQDD